MPFDPRMVGTAHEKCGGRRSTMAALCPRNSPPLRWRSFPITQRVGRHSSGKSRLHLLERGALRGRLRRDWLQGPGRRSVPGVGDVPGRGARVLVVDVVVWLTGAERDLRLRSVGRTSPRESERRSGRTLMMAATVLVVQLACRWLGLPASKAMISVMLLQVTPDLQALLHKGRLRIAGALAGAALALGASLLLGRMRVPPRWSSRQFCSTSPKNLAFSASFFSARKTPVLVE